MKTVREQQDAIGLPGEAAKEKKEKVEIPKIDLQNEALSKLNAKKRKVEGYLDERRRREEHDLEVWSHLEKEG